MSQQEGKALRTKADEVVLVEDLGDTFRQRYAEMNQVGMEALALKLQFHHAVMEAGLGEKMTEACDVDTEDEKQTASFFPKIKAFLPLPLLRMVLRAKRTQQKADALHHTFWAEVEMLYTPDDDTTLRVREYGPSGNTKLALLRVIEQGECQAVDKLLSETFGGGTN